MILSIMDLFSKKGISPSVRAKHRQANEVAWDKYIRDNFKPDSDKLPFIEFQYKMRDKWSYSNVKGSHEGYAIRFGNNIIGGYASYNACEVIATYNALIDLYKANAPLEGDMSFPALIEYFEANGIVLGGQWGTSPKAIFNYFKDNGFDAMLLNAKALKYESIDNLKEYTTYILTVYNKKGNIFRGIHTVSITLNARGKYVIHNSSSNMGPYNSLDEAINYSCQYTDIHGKRIEDKTGQVCLICIK